jgi:hypothetical protein
VRNCRFTGSWKRGVFASAGSYDISDSTFEGGFSEAAVIYNDSSGLIGQMSVNNCSFQNTGRSVWAQSGASGKVLGSGNTFAGRQPEGKAGMFQYLQLGGRTAPSTIPSASQLAPHFNYGTYTVTGTAQINYIRVGGNEVVNEMCAGRITLISSGWSLSNTGNIRPRSTARRPVGSVVVLVRNGLTNTWVE